MREDNELYICSGVVNPTKYFRLQGRSFSKVYALQSNLLEANTDVFILTIDFWPKFANIDFQGIWFEG